MRRQDKIIREGLQARDTYFEMIREKKYSMVDLWGVMGVMSAAYLLTGILRGGEGMVWMSIVLAILGIAGYYKFRG